MTDIEMELYHHGVKGMKWGVRRKQMRTASADRNIGKIGTTRSANKMMYEARNKAAEAKYYGGRTKISNNFISRGLDKFDRKMLTKAKARNLAEYDLGELGDKYKIAVQKARKDKTYRKTDEYKTARNEYGKAYVQRMLIGDERYLRIRADMNTGTSKTTAHVKETARLALEILAT